MGEMYKDEEWLTNQLDKKTKNQVANECGVAWTTIDYWDTKFKDEDKSWRDEDTLRSLYLEKGMSASEISDKFNAPRSNVLNFMKKLGIPIRGRKESVSRSIKRGRGPINTDVDVSLDDTSAYIYGVLISDGYVHKDDYDIRLAVKSKTFAETFKNALDSKGMNASIKCKDEIYTARAHSSKFVKEFYNNIDMDDTLEWNKELKIAFIRGVYDSEGSYTLSGSDSKQIRIAVTDKLMANVICECLDSIDIDFKTSSNRRTTSFDGKQYKVNVFNISIYRDVEKFLDKVEPNIKTQPSNTK